MDYVNNSNGLLARAHLNNVQQQKLENSWAPMFHDLVLNSLPMEKIRKLYCGDNGRPTKELTALTGALILQQMHDLSDIETCENYTFNNLWIEALNLGSLEDKDWSICPRTLWSHADKLTKSGILMRY
jgi:hypothetical protein